MRVPAMVSWPGKIQVSSIPGISSAFDLYLIC